MAKVISFIKLSGTIDDITFRKTAEGNIAGRKTGPSREKVLNDPNFDQTRRNAGEFKLAVRDAKLLRHSLDHALNGVKRTTLNAHVTGLLHAAALQDQEHDLGCRYAASGDLSKFEGFEFGQQLSLDVALPISITQHFNIASGSMKTEIPPFIARKRKGFPAAATHFRIVSAGAAINFEEGRFVNDIKKSPLFPLRKQTPNAICLDHALKCAPGDVAVQVLGIQFFTLVNGKEVLVKGGAVKILAAERVAAAIQVPADVPQAEKTAKPFTRKRLRAFGDERKQGPPRSGKRKTESGELPGKSDELRAMSDGPAITEQQKVQEMISETVAPTDDPSVLIANPSALDEALKDDAVDWVETILRAHQRADELTDSKRIMAVY